MTALTASPSPAGGVSNVTVFSVGVVASNPFPLIVSLLLEDDNMVSLTVTFGSIAYTSVTLVFVTDHVAQMLSVALSAPASDGAK